MDERFTSRRRQMLFLEMAERPSGATAKEVYERAQELGDTATPEAYHNIARRLGHRALLLAKVDDSGTTRWERSAHGEWLEENELAELVDPDYPAIAVTVWRESSQQINDVPESVWAELRERLASEPARALFVSAIRSYCEDFRAQVELVAENDGSDRVESARLRREAESSHRLLLRLTKYGLGLSQEAVRLPHSVEVAISQYTSGRAPSAYYDETLLEQEIARRIEDAPFVQLVQKPEGGGRKPVVGAVDGSTRGGLLSIADGQGDFSVAHAPLVSINTAVGQLEGHLMVGGRPQRALLRLPERPEDMQRQDNRHTIMAKLLHPDLSDAQYMHSVWNAMDLIEIRATARLLRRWEAANGRVEMPPADVVLRDGTVSPQDRDFTHYKEQSSYGRIVRDMIEVSWNVALTCREDGRVVCGVVKATQLAFFGPVINWYAAHAAATGCGQLGSWPMQTMNVMPDQLLVTRLLTAGRGKTEPWWRTCVVLRPFHALTNFAKAYSTTVPPAEKIAELQQRDLEHADALDPDDLTFWQEFQVERDPFVKMLRQVQYGSYFLAAVPRLDRKTMLPRFEVLVPASTDETGEDPWRAALSAMSQANRAVAGMGFDVDQEHSMFLSEPKLDVLPRLLIETHESVKVWAQELLGRVQEFVGYHLTRFVHGKRLKGIEVRPFTRRELEALLTQLRIERDRQAGGPQLPPSSSR